MPIRRWSAIFTLVTSLFFTGVVSAQPALQHPRLWIRGEEHLAQLQSWATEDNPLWAQLVAMADEAITEMEAGNLPEGDLGGYAYTEYPNENYAMLLAFVSLIHPDSAARADYANRARTLLMYVMNEVALGEADAPFRTVDFATSDRSRWHGLGFPLTVDWIYDTLTSEDKATIRSVFLRWQEYNRNAYTTNNNHPEPIGVVNDPVLIADRGYVRWSNNNYYAAHMRNMGLMALAFDPEDDPDGALRHYLNEATGAWLYVIDDQLRTDVAGGLGAEGFEYTPQSTGYILQFLLALYTAGEADTAVYGQQVSIESQPFWADAIKAYLHSLSPQPVQHEWYGPVFQPAWYGSGQSYYNPDHIESFGALGIYDQLVGNSSQLEAIRWIQLHTAPGGEDALLERMDFEQFNRAILYFMLFDPNAAAPADPRPSIPTTHYAPGMRRLLARTDWTPDSALFSYNNSWQSIDHQSGNAGGFEFYRDGEWLTKVRVGYDLDYHTSDNMNTLSIENGLPDRDSTDWRYMMGQRGSQWLYVSTADPSQPVVTEGDGFVAVHGDMTNVYNSEYEQVNGVISVTRSVVWLKPDVIIVYDTAQTVEAGFKRFNLNLATGGTVEANRAEVTTPQGQRFVISALLPSNAVLNISEVPDEVSSAPAEGEMMRYRLVSQTPEELSEAVFLHVLIGADTGTALPEIELVSDDPASTVVRVGDTIVRFSGASILVER